MDHLAGPDPVARVRDLGAAITAACEAIEHTQRIPEPFLTTIHHSRMAACCCPAPSAATR